MTAAGIEVGQRLKDSNQTIQGKLESVISEMVGSSIEIYRVGTN
jgi:hypothetical protein